MEGTTSTLKIAMGLNRLPEGDFLYLNQRYLNILFELEKRYCDVFGKIYECAEVPEREQGG